MRCIAFVKFGMSHAKKRIRGGGATALPRGATVPHRAHAMLMRRSIDTQILPARVRKPVYESFYLPGCHWRAMRPFAAEVDNGRSEQCASGGGYPRYCANLAAPGGALRSGGPAPARRGH